MADPKINWRNPWEGTSDASAYGATNAMIKLIFSYAGYQNVFGLANEIKVRDKLFPQTLIRRDTNAYNIEPREKTSLECSALTHHSHHPIYPGQRRLFLRRIEGRNPRVQADCSQHLLRESIWYNQGCSWVERSYLHQCIRKFDRSDDKLLTYASRNGKVNSWLLVPLLLFLHGTQ